MDHRDHKDHRDPQVDLKVPQDHRDHKDPQVDHKDHKDHKDQLCSALLPPTTSTVVFRAPAARVPTVSLLVVALAFARPLALTIPTLAVVQDSEPLLVATTLQPVSVRVHALPPATTT